MPLLLDLFLTFLQIGALAFGGGYGMIPLVRSFIVEKGWMTANEISNVIAIAESTPGPIAVNMATYVGSIVGGTVGLNFLGSAIATIAVVLPAFVIIYLVSNIFKAFKDNKYVNTVLEGIRPVVVAMILSTGALMIISCIYVNFGNFTTTPSIDFISLAIIVGLIILRILYKKIFNKPPSPIILILISAVLGIIVF